MLRNLIPQERITDQRQEKLILGNLISMLLLPFLEREQSRFHNLLTEAHPGAPRQHSSAEPKRRRKLF